MTEETQKLTKLIAVYGRVSTSNQENEGTIETQLLAVREFARKNNHVIVQEYLDDGWSGDSIVRPALDQLRIDAKKKIWEAVLVYDPDRLARRYSYQELIMDELRETGIEMLFVTVASPKNSEDKILHGVRGLFAEYERAKISERFRLGKLRKVREGHVLTTEAPYGYIYNPMKKGPSGEKIHGYYEIDPLEARVVKMIFAWIADEGLNIRKVVKKLQELDIKPRKSKRGVWSTSTLTTLLRNKTYIGQAHWGSSYAVAPENPIKHEKYKKMRKTSRRIRPEEEWIASQIPVPAIIEKDLFTRTREQLKINSALCPRNRKNEYLLGGKIYCVCGKKRVGEGPQHGKHLYYRCSDRIYSFPLQPECREKGINARIADNLVWNKIAGLMSSPELMIAQARRWLNTRQDKIQSSVADISVIEKEIAKLEAQEERYNKAYGAGVFDIEQLREYTSPLKDQISSLKAQAAKARQDENKTGISIMPSENEIRDFAKEAAETLSNLNFETKRAIMMSILDKVVGTQQQLEVYGYLPIVPHHVAFETIHRHRRATQCRKIYPLQSADQKSDRYF